MIKNLRRNKIQKEQAILLVKQMELNADTLSEYQTYMLRKRLFILGLIVAASLLGSYAITLGPLKISIIEVYSTLLHRFVPDCFPPPSELAERTIWYMRFPRLLMGLATGFNLAVAGAVMQPLLRNPLASPFTLGISAGAGFGAALAILFGKGLGGGGYFVVVNAFIFSLLSSLIILGLTRYKSSSPQNMILAGIALSYLFQAGTTMMQYFAESWAVTEVVFWLVGSLSKATWSSLRIILLVTVCCVPYLLMKSRELNVMIAGDEVSESLGVNVKRTRILLLVIASLLTSTTICFTGTIGFIGLVAPHISRMILGGDNRYVIPSAGLIGALLLSGADIAAMNIIPPVVIPIGVMTSFMGVPLFIYLIMKNRNEFWQ